jgi:hypothetical protein
VYQLCFASLGDPVGSGLVASLNRPGGNVTGFPVFVNDMGGKWLELFREIAPQVDRVGFMFHPDAVPNVGLFQAAEAAAPALDIKVVPIAVRNEIDIERAITAGATEPAIGGLITVTRSLFQIAVRLSIWLRAIDCPRYSASASSARVAACYRTAAAQRSCSGAQLPTSTLSSEVQNLRICQFNCRPSLSWSLI